MPKTKLYSIRKNKLSIKFQSRTNLENFEILLTQVYTESLLDKYSTVEFNFFYISWIEPFQISQIALWINELTDLNKNVSIKLPENTRVAVFFSSLRFLHFLHEKKILSTPFFDKYSNLKNRFQPFFPLTFANEPSFIELLDSLSTDDYYNVIFEEVRTAAVTKKGIIRDIVLKELGDNMYRHANGRFSNFLMIRGNTNWLKNETYLSPFEKDFFASIKGKYYLEVVVSDKGPGIAYNLKQNYLNNTPTIEENKINECDIIEYSTFSDSTSRTNEERLQDLVKKLSNDIKDIVPFTGLFQIRETVKKYRGLLLIRSGSSIISFNYFRINEEHAEVIKSSKFPSFKKLAKFGGTQIRIVLPILDDFESEAPINKNFNFKEVEKAASYQYFSIEGLQAKSEKYKIYRPVVNSYSKLKNEIKEAAKTKASNSFIIDFYTQYPVDSKIIFLLVCELMVIQRTYSIILTLLNFPTIYFEIISDSLEGKKDFEKTPLVIFTENFTRKIIGLTNSENKLLEEILKQKEFISDKEIAFGITYPHLFYYNNNTLYFELRHNRSQILAFYFTIIKDKILGRIFDPKLNIYHTDIKVLTPSGHYSSIYFENYKLIKAKEVRPLLRMWLKVFIINTKPECIISINDYCSDLIAELLSSRSKGASKIMHYPVTPASYQSEAMEIKLFCKEKKVLIFSDVLATSKTIRKIISEFDESNKYSIIVISNLSGIDFLKINNTDIKVEAINLLKSNFEDHIPTTWSPDEVYNVNKETNLLQLPQIYSHSADEILDKKRITQKFPVIRSTEVIGEKEVLLHRNLFLDQVVIPYKAYFFKVYSQYGYMPIMFNIEVILNLINDDVAQDIVTKIYSLELSTKQTFTELVYIDYENSPFKSIVKTLIKTYPKLKVTAIPYNHLNHIQPSSNDFLKAGVIVLDDALSTGENLQKLIAYCEARLANSIFCYVLINRGDENVIRRFHKTKKYGNSTVFFEYGFDAQMPVYRGENNFILQNYKELEKLLILFTGSDIVDFIAKLNKRNDYTFFLDTLIFSTNENNENYLQLRWKLEVAKRNSTYRKEVLLYFENFDTNFNIILTLFEILEHEKDIFFKSESIRKALFDSEFCVKITSATDYYLRYRLTDLSDLQIFDTLSVLLFIDFNMMSEFLSTVDLEFYRNKDCLYSLLVLLTIENEIQNGNEIRSLVLKKYSELYSGNLNNSAEQSLIRIVKSPWDFYNVSRNRKSVNSRIKAIKGILKTSFHDLPKMERLIKLLSIETGLTSIRETWESVRLMCDTAQSNFTSFFSEGFAEQIQIDLFPRFNKIYNNINLGNNSIRNIPLDGTTEEKQFLLYNISTAIKNIAETVFEDGLLNIFKNHFRIDVFPILSEIVYELKEYYSVQRNSKTKESCMVFATEVDLYRIIKNISSNIIEHAKCKNVLVCIDKVKKQDLKQVIIEFYDDGVSSDEIVFEDGLSICKELCEKYDGELTVTKLTKEFTYNGLTYNTCARIVLFDLSKDVINKPTYNEKNDSDN
jgi:hypoxanthine-guanine phosphoribosyltransferase